MTLQVGWLNQRCHPGLSLIHFVSSIEVLNAKRQESSGSWIQERTLTKFFKRRLKLFLCVHDNWSIPRHRLTRYKQGPNTVVYRLNDNFITAVEEHKGT